MKTLLGIIISFVFLLWFIASLGGMIYVSRLAELRWLIPVILGQFFLVFGILGFIAMLSAKKKGLWIDAAAMFAGTAAISLALVYHYGSASAKAAVTAHIPTLAGAGFLIAGLCGTIGSYIGSKRSAEKYRTPTEGICVEYRTRMGSGGKPLRCPVYEITLNGERVRLEKGVYSNIRLPQIGESRTLYIDETDLESYAEPIADKSVRRFGYFLFLSFAAAGLLIIVMTI